MNLLLKELRERKKLKKINAFHAEAYPKDSYKPAMSYEQLQVEHNKTRTKVVHKNVREGCLRFRQFLV